MIFAWPIPSPTAEPAYYCPSCDCYGRGDRCWQCGNPNLTIHKQPILNSQASPGGWSM